MFKPAHDPDAQYRRKPRAPRMAVIAFCDAWWLPDRRSKPTTIEGWIELGWLVKPVRDLAQAIPRGTIMTPELMRQRPEPRRAEVGEAERLNC